MSTSATSEEHRTSAVRAGIEIWYPLLGGVVAWTIHLLALASLVQFTCNVPGTTWVLHAITAVCVAMTVAAGVLAWRLVAGQADGDDGPGLPGSLAFIGRLALLVAGVNLVLIVIEEVYVVVLHGSTCA